MIDHENECLSGERTSVLADDAGVHELTVERTELSGLDGLRDLVPAAHADRGEHSVDRVGYRDLSIGSIFCLQELNLKRVVGTGEASSEYDRLRNGERTRVPRHIGRRRCEGEVDAYNAVGHSEFDPRTAYDLIGYWWFVIPPMPQSTERPPAKGAKDQCSGDRKEQFDRRPFRHRVKLELRKSIESMPLLARRKTRLVGRRQRIDGIATGTAQRRH